MSENIQEQVIKIVAERLGVAQDQISESSSFVDDLGADSLDTVELVMAFEEEFGFSIPDEDASKLRTVNDAVAYIKEYKNREA